MTCKKFDKCEKLIKKWNEVVGISHPSDLQYMFPVFEQIFNEICSQCIENNERVLCTQIAEAKAICMQRGREPIILLIHPDVLRRLVFHIAREVGPIYDYESTKFLGMQIITSSKIKDFLVIPNVSWAEMKY